MRKNSPLNLPEPDFAILGEDVVVMSSQDAPNLAFQTRCWALAQAAQDLACFIEVVPGMNNLSVQFDPDAYTPTEVRAHLQAMWNNLPTQQSETSPARIIEIPVRYGAEFGPDLARVAAHAKLSEKAVIAAHTAAQYRVYFLGFQPGFAYLGGLPAQLATPRLAEPRLHVPAGAVGIGGAQTGIYPATSPGGWNLIGQTELKLFDVQRATPSLLQSGDIVRFVAVDSL